MSCRGNPCYVEFDSKEEYLSHALLSIREQCFLEIVLPEYKVMICGGYDFTLETMVRKSYSQGIAPNLSKIIKASNLHILD